MSEKPAPLPALREVNPKTGEVVLRNPDTGQAVNLSDATLAQLAAYKVAVAEWVDRASQAQTVVDNEIIARMDKAALWTHRDGGYKLEGQSPNPTTSYKDAAKLRARLQKLVDAGELAQEALDAALPVPEPNVQVKPGPLGNLQKLGGKVGRAVRAHQVQTPKGHRSVKVSGRG